MELVRLWDSPYSTPVHLFQDVDYANLEGVAERGYTEMLEGLLS